MRLAFMGTPDFAVPALYALRDAGHEVAVVYTQPPRPAGRGKALRPSPVHHAAETLGIPVRCPEKLKNNQEELDWFAAQKFDVAIVAAYGLILPKAMLDAPERGCLNIHASLLPRWRGASPIQSAILAGDRESGVTIMQMDVGLDTGDMLSSVGVPVTTITTASSLHDELAALGAKTVVDVLRDRPPAVPQPEDGVTYAARLTKEDGRIDWAQSAETIDRQVRALTPWPGAFTTLDGVTLKIDAVAVEAARSGTPGAVLDDRLTVACGEDSALRICRIQRPGRGMMDTEAFLRGQSVAVGTRLGS
ncbi:methionyl-tRNA formyltransferase [Acetobacter sp.]|jgi:methionyl-tRNA formyltransferase|uniref:methionyl-tRNA formyltransferase n=1 Tax=Acetobacter sp. TaxID=440 RepID=UPI0025B95B26|nr:methionyl-tRNA formyltransferase [Acetobacter sp.]MCH4089749.1 methionyl-tRNA formyltransferase [Acetobacter sp.]MCI1298445.1 methionyl-tRNA formyltransferase [Acetobacter sp.]MCI1316400.1 methionyl-tRNA formyltransferase [Acetobacter sp.]